MKRVAYVDFVQYQGLSIANMICKAKIPGLNPTSGCMEFVCGVQCCIVKKVMANY